MYMEKIFVSLVIPARNEERTIAEIIDKAKPLVGEILVVDGHSKDRTQEIARQHGARVILDNQKGKGEAFRCALKEIKGEIVIFMDADGSHDPNDIPRLVAPIVRGEADLVIGSRGRGGSDELHGDLPKFFRMIASDIINLGINYRFGVKLPDSQNGFRAVKTAAIKSLNLKENTTTIEQEMTIKALRHGYKITDVPSHEYSRKYGKSSINLWKTGFRYFYSWLKYLFFDKK